jgi:hypothetical protein
MFTMRIGRDSSLAARLAASGLAALGLAIFVTPSVWASESTPSGGPNAAKWCAFVIRIGTQSGTMKNKHYLSQSDYTLAQVKLIVEATLAERAQLLAETPPEIKTAISHELSYMARLKATKYAPSASTSPFTVVDSHKLISYEHAQCGITGP